MPDPADERAGAPLNPSDLQAIALRLARESRRSALIGFVAGAVVVAGLGATFYAAMDARTSLNAQVVQNTTLKAQVDTAQVQATTAKTLLTTTASKLQACDPAAAASAVTAINRLFQPNMAAMRVLTRVYIHAQSASQQSKAAAIANALHTAGYVVASTDVQPSPAYPETEVHYSTENSASESEVAAITTALGKLGIPAVKRLTASTPTDPLATGSYSVWLAANVQ